MECRDFIWNVNTIVNALRVYQPPMAEVFERMLPYFYTDKEQEMLNELFPTCENISVDYAIMEKAEEIYVFPASFGWSDLGTWGSLHENSKKDAHNNACIGNNIKLYETRNCIIHTTQEKKVVVQGLDGYIVAEKNDKLLICRLTEEQRIKDFAESKVMYISDSKMAEREFYVSFSSRIIVSWFSYYKRGSNYRCSLSAAKAES